MSGTGTSDDPIGDALERETAAHRASPDASPIDDPGEVNIDRPDTPPVESKIRDRAQE